MISRGTSRPTVRAKWAVRRCCACWKLGGSGSRSDRATTSRLAVDAVHVVTGPRPGCQDEMEPMATIFEPSRFGCFVLPVNVGRTKTHVAFVLATRSAQYAHFAHSAHRIGASAGAALKANSRGRQRTPLSPGLTSPASVNLSRQNSFVRGEKSGRRMESKLAPKIDGAYSSLIRLRRPRRALWGSLARTEVGMFIGRQALADVHAALEECWRSNSHVPERVRLRWRHRGGEIVANIVEHASRGEAVLVQMSIEVLPVRSPST